MWPNFTGTVPRNFTMNPAGSPRDYDTLKQQYDKANMEILTLRIRCDSAMKVSFIILNILKRIKMFFI